MRGLIRQNFLEPRFWPISQILTCGSEAYSERPGYFGIPPARSQEELDKAFQEMHDAGFQIATHSKGDREIDMVLTAIERAQARNPRPDARHRIEHASAMNRAMLERAKKAGVIRIFVRCFSITSNFRVITGTPHTVLLLTDNPSVRPHRIRKPDY